MSADKALGHWGGGTDLRLIARRENAVYHVRLPDGRRAALRLHRAGYQDAAAIEAELRWCAGLAATGFPCPVPIATQSGALLATLPDGTRASAVEWIDAEPVGAATTPDMIRALGALIARLHLIPPEGFAHPARPDWGRRGLLGDAPNWGPFWQNPALSTTEAALLQDARTAADTALAQMNDHGPVHADILGDNVLLDMQGALHLIDFDDCGWGPRPYDLGTVAVQWVGDAQYEDRCDALLDGYAARHKVSHDTLDLMVLLRAMASTGWIATRAVRDDPRQRNYAARAVTAARRWLPSG